MGGVVPLKSLVAESEATSQARDQLEEYPSYSCFTMWAAQSAVLLVLVAKALGHGYVYRVETDNTV